MIKQCQNFFNADAITSPLRIKGLHGMVSPQKMYSEFLYSLWLHWQGKGRKELHTIIHVHTTCFEHICSMAHFGVLPLRQAFSISWSPDEVICDTSHNSLQCQIPSIYNWHCVHLSLQLEYTIAVTMNRYGNLCQGNLKFYIFFKLIYISHNTISFIRTHVHYLHMFQYLDDRTVTKDKNIQ